MTEPMDFETDRQKQDKNIICDMSVNHIIGATDVYLEKDFIRKEKSV